MDKPTDNTLNSDVEPIMPLYEPPVAVKLGEVGVGTGQIVVCQSGSSNATLCQTGSTAAQACANGSIASGCFMGSAGSSPP